MRKYLRQALFNALAELGDHNRQIIICHLQRQHGIRFIADSYPNAREIESALTETFGSSASILIEKFEKELQQYPVPMLRM